MIKQSTKKTRFALWLENVCKIGETLKPFADIVSIGITLYTLLHQIR